MTDIKKKLSQEILKKMEARLLMRYHTGRHDIKISKKPTQ